MLLNGIEVNVRNKPAADPDFVPMGLFMDAFLKTARKPISIAVERENGNISVFDTFIHGDAQHRDADLLYIERSVKFMLWSRGGFRITICGDNEIARYVASLYAENGERAFDRETMSNIYEKEFEVVSLPLAQKPVSDENSTPIGGYTNGCRIGIDVGGSNIKVCAVMDGRIVYSSTDPWQPMQHTDADYHVGTVIQSLQHAADALPRVDTIGISTAGIYVNSKTRIASIYRNVSKEQFDEKIIDIYPRSCAAIGENIPFAIANDGDAAALSGALSNRAKAVVGISMGTSEAGGYVDRNGNITGRLNEFAFVPVDMRKVGLDSWSGDLGCGVAYLSSEAVARLAEEAGLAFHCDAPALRDKVREVQKLVQSGDEKASNIYDTIGCYLAHAIYGYSKFYDMDYAVIMGGITAGPGGAILLRRCRQVLKDEYPSFALDIILPEEQERAAGQSFAAATLVKL